MATCTVATSLCEPPPPLPLPTLTPRPLTPPRSVHQWPVRRRGRGGEQQQQNRPEELSAAVGPAAERDRGRDRPTGRVAQRRNRSVSPITLRPLLILLQLLSVPSSHEG